MSTRDLLRAVARRLPPRAKRRVRSAAVDARRRATRLTDRPDWGDLRRSVPFDETYGASRGTPVDRWYIDRFLSEHASLVSGNVLEVSQGRYATGFGGAGVAVDVLDIDGGNPDATVLADLAVPGSLPEGRYDVAIVTQTLQYVSDPAAAVRNLVVCLRPSGTLLLTAPAMGRLDPSAPPGQDRWRFTPAGLRELMTDAPTSGAPQISGVGNLTSALAFLLGLAAEELHHDELDYDDPDHPLLVCAVVRSR